MNLSNYKEEINKKFRYKAQAIESEIQQEAQTLSDKKKPSFQKLVKVDKKMTNLIEAEKKYKKHLMNKDAIERKLLEDVRKKLKKLRTIVIGFVMCEIGPKVLAVIVQGMK